MHTDVTTFAGDDHDPAAAIARLSGMGFEFGPSRPVIRSLLETFDGRLGDAALRLEVRECGDLELVLTGERSARAHLVVASVPRFADDLPPGPFRGRLAAVAEVRALLPVLRVTATRSEGFRRNRAGKIVGTVALYEHLRVDDHDLGRWTIEISELAGYSKQAGRARDVMTEMGLTLLDDDTLGFVATTAGVGSSVHRSIRVALDPMMPAVDGFRAVLADLTDTIAANWPGTVERIDPEFLHDLRVAVRRTRSVIGAGKDVLPPAIVERAAERFGWLGALTGPARDLDVQLINWSADTRALQPDVVTALEPVHLLLGRHCDAVHSTLTRALQSSEGGELLTSATAWWRGPDPDEPAGVDAEQPLGAVVAKRIARAHTTLIKRGRLIQPDTPAERVHDLRKDAKKLRYLLECFGGLLDDAPRKAFVRRLKTFQDNLGEHHDAAIHVAELRAISHELHEGHAPSETMLAIGQLFRLLDLRRIATRLEFAEHFAAYDTKATRRDLDAALAGATR